MNKYFLERKECHLIQSGTFKKMISDITGRNSIINLNYMGSAEFEGNALPNSTRRMIVNIDFYDVFTFHKYINSKGEPLKVYAPKMFIEHISKIVDNLIEGNLNYSLKEYCTLPQYLKGENHYNRTDFWWDIENDFYIFFGNKNEELILEAQRAMRHISIGYIKFGNWNKLSKYYLLNNPDLNEEAKQFLTPKKNNLIKRLTRKY